ncbi:3-oxoacyl-ACP reductase FabG [Paenibacillus sediminis]|uniref:3-oxoacyl-[acyl-carrier protein] reductase n=1 Tax=Paenibacillus sediminis TaxID=664909 RepID=A0ABS4H189_9BACL|nr:3-oxoacyl-ACP reductase FabG [Paenibacillus sediminis]MBP1936132.1 3-oxoacyl-[acyl-carrier protein] reductase [Paenibacillus sediminis]
MRLEGKVAIITGGGNGIGRETAALFVREGTKVCVADYDETAGQRVVDELLAIADECAMFVKVDVSSAESVEHMARAVIESWGTPDILINNAGITQDSMLTKMSIEQWQRVIDVNLNGVFYCTRFIAPYMVERGKGKIINTSSIVGMHGNIGQTNYAATKAGVIGMTKTWAKELGHKGIRVNAVAPGYVETGMVANVPDKVLQLMLDKVPLHRLGRPSDIAHAYLYLASDESDYVNGTVLEVNGGLVI